MIAFTQRTANRSQSLLIRLLLISLSILLVPNAEAAVKNKKPIAKITTNTKVINENLAVTLDGTGSIDKDGSIASYAWAQTGGPVVDLTGAATDKLSFTTPLVKKVTKLTLTLIVIDDLGLASAKAKIVITVKPVNTLPVVNAGADQTVSLNSPVSLDGSSSHDPDSDGFIKSWSWTQTAGAKVKLMGAKTSKLSFTSPIKLAKNATTAELKFKLTVTDDEKGKASDEVVVKVQTAPIANASLQLENKNFTEYSVLARDTPTTLTWTVKNTSEIDLTNVVLAAGTATGNLIIESISPATVGSWAQGTSQTFSVSVTAPASIAAGLQAQSWSFTYDTGKPIVFPSHQTVRFSLKTTGSVACTTQTYSFQDWAFPGAAPTETTQINSINTAGDKVGFLTKADNAVVGFYNATSVTYGVDPNNLLPNTRLLGVNAGGQIIGTYVDNTGSHNFVQTGANGVKTLITAPGSLITPAISTVANTVGDSLIVGINDSGLVVGQYTLGQPNDLGQSKFGFTFDTNTGTYDNIESNAPDAITDGTTITGINNDGWLVGTVITDSATGLQHGFVYDGATWATIADINVNGTAVTGINNLGEVVGWSVDANNGYHGFVYDAPTKTVINSQLDAPDTSAVYGYSVAVGINDLGEVVGGYSGADGIFISFVATPNPCP